MRDTLSQLESASLGNAQKIKLIDALFRSIHSFKGNLSIVGLRSAEELKQGMENILRAISQRWVPISHALLDTLLVGD